jgi:hypothetical protein
MNMVQNNLNRRENIRMANQFAKQIKAFPTNLIRIVLEFDPDNKLIQKISTAELEMMDEEIVNLVKKKFGKKIHICSYSQLDWDTDEEKHKILVKYIVAGRIDSNRIEHFYDKLDDLNDLMFNSKLWLMYIEENSQEDVFIESFPVQFEEQYRRYTIYRNSFTRKEFHNPNFFNYVARPLKIH